MKFIRYVIEAIFLAILMALSKMLPAPMASNFGGWIGRNIGPRLSASRKAVNNIKSVLPDTTDEQTQKIVSGMWDNLGRVMMEYPHLKHISKNQTEIVGKEILEQHKDQAAIFFTAHLANWEVCPPSVYQQLGFTIHSIYRAPNNPLTGALLERARSIGGNIENIPKSRTGTRNIVKALQENKRIGILIDQKYNEGIAADFMGRPAMTSPAFVQLAQKFNCPLIPLRIERIKNTNFRVTILPPLDVQNKTIEDAMTECHTMLEGWIKERPSEWLWLHRRWDSKQLKENIDEAA